MLYNNYDNLIIKCVPDYEKILKLLVEHIPKKSKKILDLGVGTGNIESYIFKKFPQVTIEGLDISSHLLKIAKEKHKKFQFIPIKGDIRESYFKKKKYDCVISSLTIHHMEDNEKIKIFSNIFSALKKEGIFINFDMVMPEKSNLDKMREKLFLRMKKQGLSAKFINMERQEMKERDKLAKIKIQKNWLKETGFSYRVLYKKGLFSVYACKKI